MKSRLWNRWLSRLFPQIRVSRPLTERRRRGTVAVEQLEDRVVPATFIWDGGGADNKWSTAANWGDNIAPTGNPAALEDLVFTGTVKLTTRNDLPNVAGSAPTFKSITVSSDDFVLEGNKIVLGDPSISTSGNIIVGTGVTGVNIKLDVQMGGGVGNRQIFTVNSNADLTLSGKLSGATGVELTKRGAGVLILTNDNSAYTGQITIDDSSGVVRITHRLALGSTGAGTTVGTNSTLQTDSVSGNIAEPLLLNGPGADSFGALYAFAGNSTWSGTVTLDSNATFGGENGASVNITGTITDSGAGFSVIKEGLGEIIFSAFNTYDGTTTINNGILTIRHSHALGSADGTAATATIVNTLESSPGTPVFTGTLQVEALGANLNVLDELLILNGRGQLNGSIGAVFNAAGDNIWEENVILGSPAPSGYDVTVGAALNSSIRFDGVLSDPNGTRDLTKNGLGKVILTRANTYRGDTSVSAGILEIRDSRALGTLANGTSVSNGATLQLSVDSRPDSVTGTTNTLEISENIIITGLGAPVLPEYPDGVGALYSESGINVLLTDLLLTGTEAGVGVDSDPNQITDNTYFVDEYSLTLAGDVQDLGAARATFVKMADGHLILPNNNTFLGKAEIRDGWVTIRSERSLGGRISGIGDTVQPGTEIFFGASLHIYPLSGDLDIRENITAVGLGDDHAFGLMDEKGAIVNISGNNTFSGDLLLKGETGIGVEEIFEPSQLTTTGFIHELVQTAITVDGDATGGPAEDIFTADTGATSGTVIIDFTSFTLEDSLTVYYGVRGAGGVVLLATGLIAVTNQIYTINYGPGSTSVIQIIINEGGNPDSSTIWEYTATIIPDVSSTNSGITKLGSQALLMQGDGVYGGDNSIQEGVLVVQNPTALGLGDGTTTTVEDGAAIVLANSNPKNLGGIEAGYGVWGEQLVLNGQGNNTLATPLASLTVLSDPSIILGPKVGNANENIVPIDVLWKGPVTLNTTTAIDVQADSRLVIDGVVDDATNVSSATGSGLTKIGTGELYLAGTNTYRGTTYVGTSDTDNPGSINEFFNSASPAPLPGGILTIGNDQALGGPAIGERQTVTATGPAGSTFTLSFNGSPTLPLPVTAAATLVQDELNKLASLADIGASVLVTKSGNVFTVTFTGTLGGFDLPQLQFTPVAGTPNIQIATTRHGAGGTIVQDGSQLQIQRGITVAAEPLIISGDGVGVADVPAINPNWFNIGSSPINNGEAPGKVVASDTSENVAGRVTGVAADPSDPEVIYVSTAGGGVWKTKDSGNSWVQMFDAPAGTFTGAIAVAPSDPRVIYVGTGEANNSGDSFYGTGVYKSTDSGKTWTLLEDSTLTDPNPMDGLAISKIVVDPQNANRIYVAASDRATNGPQQNPTHFTNSVPGVYRFQSGSWFNLTNKETVTRVGKGPGPDDDLNRNFGQKNTVYSDIALGSTGTLFMAIGNPGGSAHNAVYFNSSPNSNSPVWRVADFPAIDNSVNNGNIKIATAGGRIWAVITNPVTQGLRDIYSSSDVTVDWAEIADTADIPTLQGSEGFYASAIVAVDGDTVYVAGVSDNNNSDGELHDGMMFVSNNANSTSSTWTDVTITGGRGPASDTHALAVDSLGRILNGNDGGVWRLDPASSNSWRNMNGNLAITLFNGVSMHPNDPNIVLGGSQDNGTEIYTGSQDWDWVDFGNGGKVYFDPSNPSIAYHVADGRLFKSTTGGLTWSSTSILNSGVTGYFPLVVDAVSAVSSRILAGGSGLRESTNKGLSFTNLNSPITVTAIGAATYQGEYDPTDLPFDHVPDKGASTYDPDTIYVTNGTQVRVTKDHGQTWNSNTTDPRSPVSDNEGDIVDLVVDPRDRDTVYAVYNGFGGGQIWKSDNAGRTWQNITGNLKDVPAWKLVIDPRTNQLYVGNDDGVYVSQGGGLWSRFGAGMPHVQVKDLELNQTFNMLTAATYGRSMFQLYLSTPAANSGALRALSGSSVWTGPVLLAGDTTIGVTGTQEIDNGISTAALTIVGRITDLTPDADYTLTKDFGAGDLYFAGDNLYGGVTLVKDGVLGILNPKALGVSDADANTVVFENAALELYTDLELEPVTISGHGASQFNSHDTGALRNVSGHNTFTGTLTFDSDLFSDVVIGVNSGSSLTIGSKSPLLGEGTIVSDNIDLNKELTGVLILASANLDFDAKVNVNQGVVNVRHNDALGTGGSDRGTRVLDGAQLEVQGDIIIADEFLTLSGTGLQVSGVGTGALESVGGANTWQGPITLAQDPGLNPDTTPPNFVSIGVLFTHPNDSLALEGMITDGSLTLGLEKVGPGLLILDNATNNYGGLTTVRTGALRVLQNGSLGLATEGVLVRPGGSLELDGDTSAGGNLVVTDEELTLNGTGAAEVQTFTLSGTTGTFKLFFDAASTGNLNFDATALQVQSALNGLNNIGNVGGSVSVSKVGNVFTVVFGGSLLDDDVPELTATVTGDVIVSDIDTVRQGAAGALRNVAGDNEWSADVFLETSSTIGVEDTTSLIVSGEVQDLIQTLGAGNAPSADLTKVGLGILTFPGPNSYTGATLINQGTLIIQDADALGGANLVSEIQDVTVTGPTSGSFRLRFNGSALTTPLTHNSTASAVEDALELLSTIGNGNVNVTKSGSTFRVRFQGTLANLNLPAITSSGSGGTGADIVTIQDGSEGTVVADGATLALDNSAGMSVGTEPLTIAGLGFTGTGALRNLSGDNSWNGTIILADDASISVDDANDRLTITEEIIDNGGGFGITKSGDGTLQYTGDEDNTYSGDTLVEEGVLELNMDPGVDAMSGNLIVGDGNPDTTAAVDWLEDDQLPADTDVTVNSNGLARLNNHDETIGDLAINDGIVDTGDAGTTAILSITSLNMEGGTLDIDAATTVLLDGNVTATSSDTVPAVIQGGGVLSLGDATRTFNITHGPVGPPDLIVDVPIVGDPGVGLAKTGDGLLELNAINAYDGDTTVTAGTVQVDGEIADVVLNGGTVGGIGTVGNITSNDISGSSVAPGDSIGTLTTGNVVLKSNDQYFIELSSNGGAPTLGNSDLLLVDGDVNLGNAKLAGAILSNIPIGESFLIMTASGQISGQFATGDVAFIDGRKFDVIYEDTGTADNVFLERALNTATMTLTSSVANPVYGQAVVFTATLTPEQGAGIIPDDLYQVKFTLDDVVYFVPVIGGKAILDPAAVLGAPLGTDPAPHVITAEFQGGGDYAAVPPKSINVTVAKASTTVGLSSTNQAGAVFGETVTITATVNPVAPGAGTRTGTVQFFRNGVLLGSDDVNGSGQASINFNLPTNQPVGTYSLTATYSGDDNFKGSSSSNFQQSIGKASTTTDLTSTGNTTLGQTVTFTVTVAAAAPGSGTPTGSVTFKDGATTLGTVQLNGGVASLPVSSLTVANHTITATYSGDINFKTGTDTLSHTVGKGNSAINVTFEAVSGGSIKFTAQLSAVSPATGIPTGILQFGTGVTFIVDGVTPGTKVAVDGSGKAFFTIALGAGSHTIQAVYTGDAKFNGSNTTVSLGGPTTTQITASNSPSVFGEVVTFDVGVTGSGAGNVTGSVTLRRRINPTTFIPIETKLLVNGQTSFSVSSLAVGSHNIEAKYISDGFSEESFDNLTQVVNVVDTTTTVTSSKPSSVVGDLVVFTATVDAVNPSIAIPTGANMVEFFVDDGVSGPVSQGEFNLNSSGVATFSTNFTAGGTYTVTARYKGDGSFNLSSDTFEQKVGERTTTSVNSTQATPRFNQDVEFVATVTSSSGTPTGTVTFYVDGVQQGTRTLTAGKASISVSGLNAGNHIVRAVYNGADETLSSPAFAGSEKSITKKIARARARIELTASSSKSDQGSTVAFTAVAIALSPTTATPKGRVVFFVNGVKRAVATLDSSGQITVNLGKLPVGISTIQVVYKGSSNFAGGASDSLQHKVIRAGGRRTADT